MMFDPEKDELIARLRSKAQEWRDRAFTSQHMIQLKSDTLEECARELDAELTRRLIDAQAAVIDRVSRVAYESAGLVAEEIRKVLAAAPEPDEYEGAIVGADVAPEQTLGHPGADEVFAQLQARRVSPGHTEPAAPEQTRTVRTEPAFSSSPVGGANLRPERRPSVGEVLLDTANARAGAAERAAAEWKDQAIAEGRSKLANRHELKNQESATQQLSSEVVRLSSERNEWKAKCEAAEQQRLRTQLAADGVEKRRQDSESEAAALRAEQAEFRAALQVAQQEADGLRAELKAAKREARECLDHWTAEIEQSTALRAEVERQGALIRQWELRDSARLSTATELLLRWTDFDFDCPEEEYDEGTDCYEKDGAALEKLYADSAAFLSTAPAPTEREKAERAVLEACAAMSLNDDDPDADPLEPQEHSEDCYVYTDDQHAIAKAELARRAVK